MVDYLPSMTSRQRDLLDAFGRSGCLTDASWAEAMVAEIEDNSIRLNSDDMRWLYANGGKCQKAETSRTGFKIITEGQKYASVYLLATSTPEYIGKTDATIETPPGTYTLKVSKVNFEDQNIEVVVEQDKISEYMITLEPKATDPEIPNPVGPILEWTGNRKFPNPIKKGKDNWFGVEFKNIGDQTWVGYLGVKLTPDAGDPWTWEGDATKATSITVGTTKYVWVKVPVPAEVGTGNLAVSILKYTVSE
jgi:hypothetical protein